MQKCHSSHSDIDDDIAYHEVVLQVQRRLKDCKDQEHLSMMLKSMGLALQQGSSLLLALCYASSVLVALYSVHPWLLVFLLLFIRF